MYSRLILLLVAYSLCQGSGWAAQLRVAVEHRWRGAPLKLGEMNLQDGAANAISLTRLAYLLSAVKLQRADGGWIETKDWSAYLDVEKGRTGFVLSGLPDGSYTALRFDVGLDAATDKSDPATRPPGHALHPDLNGLHWGWRGGYIFLALEGQYRTGAGELSGYSYHLAGEQCRGTVEIPLSLDLSTNRLLRLSCDVEQLLQAGQRIDVTAQNSTHSREGDSVAAHLADNAVQLFAPIAVENDNAAAPAPVSSFVDIAPGIGVPVKVPPYFPRVNWPADNVPSEPGVKLGQRLFEEPRLSRNNSQSCATCHSRTFAFADPRPVSLGAEGQRGSRNAMPLFNLAWKTSFFWDGRSPSLRDQVLQPIQDENEMHETLPSALAKLAADPSYPPQFTAVFGSAGITSERVAKALEQFLLTLVSHDSRFDRSLRGEVELTEPEKRGFEMFFTEFDPRRGQRGADCFHCHSGALFTDHQFHNNGLDELPSDLGRERQTSQTSDRGKFVTPSLRNITLTAPYMHDGRFKTLEEVVEHYDHGVRRSQTLDPNLAKHPTQGLRFSEEEKQALLAFLKTLTDPQYTEGTTR